MVGLGGFVLAQEKNEAMTDSPIKPEKIQGLVKDLGHQKFEKREEAYGALRKIGEPAREELKKALDSKDPEIRWRASRLLCLLDSEKTKRPSDDRLTRKILRLPEELRREDGDALHDFDALSDHLNTLFEGLFDEDEMPFRFRFFDHDFPRIETDIQKLLEDFNRETGSLSIRVGEPGGHYQFMRTENGESYSFSLDIAPNGTVTARKESTDAEGNKKTEEYKADSLDEFKKKYPEVSKDFDLDGFSIEIDFPKVLGKGPRGLGLKLDRAPFGFERKFYGKKVLGVYLDPVSDILRLHLGLDKDEGVVVKETAKGSFAEKVGIKAMDILTAINGSKVKDADDIRRVLSKIEKDDAVVVDVVRCGKAQKLEGKYFYGK